ncbi:MAG: hypothetical protein HGB08_00375 [Candidatus Moranbacteria bacterium]|nr:hypothetical protein [Candidatus Moranbacteria bacterium]
MFESQIKKKYQICGIRTCQGDILRDVTIAFGLELSDSSEGESEIELEHRYYNYAVVLSQDCDLSSDYNERNKNAEIKEKIKNNELEEEKAIISNDKYLPAILICPAYLLSDFVNGSHITSWSMNSELKNENNQKKLKSNNEFKRYHYIRGDSDLGIPELVLDFKHFMSVPRDTLYKIHNQVYIATISELFREELSQRFSNYISRIGLPEI